jgi:hypothetical protein
MQRPRLGEHVPKARPSAKSGDPPEQALWAFSFRYFRELKFFGVGGKDAGWFTAMLEKLSELSRKTIASTNSNRAEKMAWRLHEIDWAAKGIPIQRDALNWIDRPYLENEKEFPLQQFQITKALGRVIGFFDERRIFNVVLLDPMHNLQPSDYSDYKVRATIVSETVSAGVIRFIENRLETCKEAGCVCRTEYAKFQEIASNNDGGTTLLVHMSRELFVRVTSCVTGNVADSVPSIIEASIDRLEK